MVNATTLARVKAHLGDTGSANDTLLTSFIESVSREFEAHIGYPLLQAERTEWHNVNVGDRALFLSVLPIVSVAAVKISPTYWDFASLSALTADQDYRVDLECGIVHLNVTPLSGFQKAEVRYTAGLGATDAAVVTAAGDMALAADIQVAEEWRRRFDPATISIPGPKGSKQLDAPHRLLPRVRELLGRYQRILVGVQ
ncbi:MAG: hypothetical protein VW239_04780 [Candidatus Nanopelagicales bacterium]